MNEDSLTLVQLVENFESHVVDCNNPIDAVYVEKIRIMIKDRFLSNPDQAYQAAQGCCSEYRNSLREFIDKIIVISFDTCSQLEKDLFRSNIDNLYI
jgi:hypothetical protein